MMIGVGFGQSGSLGASVQARAVQMTIIRIAANLPPYRSEIDLAARFVDRLYVQRNPVTATDRILQTSRLGVVQIELCPPGAIRVPD